MNPFKHPIFNDFELSEDSAKELKKAQKQFDVLYQRITDNSVDSAIKSYRRHFSELIAAGGESKVEQPGVPQTKEDFTQAANEKRRAAKQHLKEYMVSFLPTAAEILENLLAFLDQKIAEAWEDEIQVYEKYGVDFYSSPLIENLKAVKDTAEQKLDAYLTGQYVTYKSPLGLFDGL